ncbi:MAG: T9SS type A sorting domain-containing protein [Bacteroidia bacterium]
MNKLSLLLFLFFFSFASHIFGQKTIVRKFAFDPSSGPALIENGDTSYSAFTGGFHKPYFNNIDINLDGIQDLLVFDKEDYQTIIYIGNGDSLNPEFMLAPEYEFLLPKLYAWVKVLDFNGDDKPDIFTSNNIGGVMVYKNTSTSKEIKFELYNDDLKYFDVEIRFYTPLFVAPSDVPAVDDIDGDGDLDILAFDSGGGNITYYQNQSMEVYGHKDSFNFLVPTFCWGRFQESDTSNEIVFAPTCYLYKNAKHAGSNMLTLDIDNDGDKDLLLSDVSYETVILLENGWNPNSSNGHNRDTMIKAYTNFPSYDKPIEVDLFPSISYCDINFDGANDLVLAPTSQEINFVVRNTWAYENIGTGKKPRFKFSTDEFLQEGTVETGEFSKPAVFDYDGDGDFDLIVASPTPYTNFEYDKAYYRLFLYENVGTKQDPLFKLIDEDYLALAGQKHVYVNPAFGDADNNGTIDLLLGLENGKVAFYPNSNTPDKAADLKFSTLSFMDIDLSAQSAPCVYDVNGDGDNDLLLGSINGKLAYYEWDQDLDSSILVSNEFLNISVGHPVAGIGFSVPRIGDFDDDGNDELAVSNSFGKVSFFMNFTFDSEGYSEEDVILNRFIGDVAEKDFGANLSIEIADLNGDTLSDLIVGGKRGGVQIAYGKNVIITGVLKPRNNLEIEVFPNPAKSSVVINWTNKHEFAQVQLIDLSGKEVHFQSITKNSTLSIEQLDKGLYVLMLNFNDGTSVAKKFLKE